jgi:hypothetical protein
MLFTTIRGMVLQADGDGSQPYGIWQSTPSDFEGETPQKWSPKLNHPWGYCIALSPLVVALDQVVHCETEDDWVSAIK